MDINDIEKILETYEITPTEFDQIQKLPRFVEVLKSEIIAHQSAINTEQRIKLKSAALLEGWLLEANARLHDHKESLAAKVELAKFLGRLNGMGLTNTHATGEVGEKFSITINLGADNKVTFEKELPPKVIEHEHAQKEP